MPGQTFSRSFSRCPSGNCVCAVYVCATPSLFVWPGQQNNVNRVAFSQRYLSDFCHMMHVVLLMLPSSSSSLSSPSSPVQWFRDVVTIVALKRRHRRQRHLDGRRAVQKLPERKRMTTIQRKLVWLMLVSMLGTPGCMKGTRDTTRCRRRRRR